MHPRRAEGVDGERCRQCRVDPARDGDHHLAEAVLVDVVSEPEDEGFPHLLELRLECRHVGLGSCAECVRRSELQRLDLGHGRTVPLEGATADVSEPPRDRVGWIDVDQQQRLLEPGCAGHDLARVVEHDRVAVEDELVLSADEVAEREEAGVVASAGDQHLLTLLGFADVERRRREVDEQLRSGKREIGCRRAGLPDVLADRRPDQYVAEAEEEQVAPPREVAMLVENAVVGEIPLPVDAADGAVGQHGAAVVQVCVEEGDADERRDAGALARDRPQRLSGRSDETGPEQEILGRVARDCELGEDHEVGAGLTGGLGRRHDPLAVSVEVADDGVHLRKRQPHAAILSQVAFISRRGFRPCG